jgi:hypothetical protein
MTNQKINEIYMSKKKRETVLGHNFISIKNKKYYFDENNLIILREVNKQPQI